MKFAFSQQVFEKYWNIKLHENSSSGSRVFPCGQTDMTRLTVAFRNFPNMPKKWILKISCDGIYWINYYQDKHMWWPLMNMETDLRLP